jgi:hypothetical protein
MWHIIHFGDLYIFHSTFPQCTVFVGSHCLQMFMLMKLLASVNKKKIYTQNFQL